MRVRHVQIGMRSARIFAGEAAPLEALEPPRPEDDVDEEDAARGRMLADVLAAEFVYVVGYPGNDENDAWNVYIEQEGHPPLFCCVVLPEALVERELERATTTRIVEGFTLQVVPASVVTVNVMAAAVETWIERNFPGMQMPELLAERWEELEGADVVDVVSVDVLALEPPPWLTDRVFEPAKGRPIVHAEDEAA